MTISTKRPSADIQAVGVVPSTGTAVWSVVGDSNAGTYATGTTNSGFAIMATDDLAALASNVRLKSVQLRVQDGNNGLGGQEVQIGWVRLRDTDGQEGASLPLSRGTTGLAQHRGNVETTAPGGKAWDRTVWNRMQLKMAFKTSQAGQYLRIYEIYVDLDTNTQPVTSAVTASGFTVTTRPDLSLTYTDADLDPQVSSQWKVFSAAQYGAVGFDPNSSVAVWDSGQVYGDASTISLPVDLVNGTTYKAYARTAQDWSGPLGELWWSDWAASSAFTVAVTPPPKPVLTITQDLTLPAYRNRLRVSLAGMNILTAQQSSVEDGTTTGWAATGNANISNVATWSADGTRSLQLSSIAAGTMNAEISTRPRVQPGTIVTGVTTERSAAVSRSARANMKFYDIAGGLLGTSFTGASVATATGSDTLLTVSGTVPAGAYTAALVVEVLSTGGAAELHRFDKMGILLGVGTTWVLGGYVAGTSYVSFEVAQRVSANISRGPARNWLHPQVVSCGALTTTTDGFYPRQGNDTATFMRLDRASPVSPSNVSQGMIEWTVRVGAFSYLDIGLPGGGFISDGTHPYAFPVVPGKDFTFDLWAWCDTGTKNIRLTLVFTDTYNNTIAATTAPAAGAFALTTTAQKCSVNATAPAGAVFARIEVENNGGGAAINWKCYVYFPRFRLTSESDENWPGQVWSFTTDTVRSTWSVPLDGRDYVEASDHEAPPGRPMHYRARTVAVASNGSVVASNPSDWVSVYMDPPARSVIKDPFQPENAAVVMVEPYWRQVQTVDADIYQPLGRDGDPVQIGRWIGGQNTDYTFVVLSDLELYRLQQLLPAVRPLLLQYFDGGQRYVLLGADRGTDQVTPGSQESFRVNVRTIECKRP